MGLLDLFKKKEAALQTPELQKSNTNDLESYAGMRVEVTTLSGDLLFVAKMLGIHGNNAELHQYSESEASEEANASDDDEPIHVNIRGYHDRDRKAVYMEGFISPLLSGASVTMTPLAL